jgi:hypothetical protein
VTTVGRWRPAAVLVIVASTLAACSSGTRAAAQSAHPAVLCAAVSKLRVANDAVSAVGEPPTPFASEQRALNAQQAAMDAVAALAPPALTAVGTFDRQGAVVTEALLAAWGSDGTALLAAADAGDATSVTSWVMRDGLPMPDGTTLTYGQMSDENRLAGDQLDLACTKPPGGYHPLVDSTSVRVPPSALAYVDDLNTVVVTRITTSGTLGSDPHRIPTRSVSDLSFSPDGRALLWQSGWTVWLAAADGSNPTQLNPSDQPWTCPSWSPEGRGLLVVRKLGTARWVLSRVTAGAVTDLTPPAPFRRAACAEYLDAGHILLQAHDPATNTLAVYEADRDGTGRHLFAALPGCAVILAGVSPDHTKVLLNAGCDDMYRNGAYSVPITGGRPKLIVTGHLGAPAWASDSRHILFGYIAFGQPLNQPSLWVAAIDGGGAHALLRNPWASWPTVDTNSTGNNRLVGALLQPEA